MQVSPTSFKGNVNVDGKEILVSVALQSSGKVEEVALTLEAISGATDYYVGHQGMERFVLTTHEVVWDAWVHKDNQISDQFFALRTQIGNLWVEAQYKGRQLSQIAVVDPNLYTGYAKLLFERSKDGNEFSVKAVDGSLLSVTYSLDNSSGMYKWASSFSENDFRFALNQDGSLRFYCNAEIYIDISPDLSDEAAKARNAIVRTASLLRQIANLIYNTTHQTI
jgi:hypothetical protein